jgi:hypothetical protein
MILFRDHGAGESHVVEEGIGGLAAESGGIGLPAESPDETLPRFRIEEVVGAARDAIAVAVIGVGHGGD